jgi:hypothetical protein
LLVVVVALAIMKVPQSEMNSGEREKGANGQPCFVAGGQ